MWNHKLPNVINKLMRRIVEVHSNEEILLVLDELSNPFEEDMYDWSILDVPPRLKLVLVLKPTKRRMAKSTIVLPHNKNIRIIKLDRQYRSSRNIQQIINLMSSLFAISKSFTSLLPEVSSGKMGHDIPGDVIEWYDLEGDARGLLQFLFLYLYYFSFQLNQI